MAAGDLTATSIYIGSAGEDGSIISTISAANLAAATDTIHIIPIPGRNNQIRVIKVERAAA